MIARHPRSYEREDFVFDPLHYLALLEQKIGALDQAAPLVGWDLPGGIRHAASPGSKPSHGQARQTGVRPGLGGCWRYSAPRTCWRGVREAIARGAIGFDAVKHLVLCRIERRPPRLDLTVYPYLPRAIVATTSARSYMDLLTGVVS